MKFISFLISTFFYVGKIPMAPGTWASIAALPFIYFLMPVNPWEQPPWVFLAVLGVVFIVGVVTSGITEKSLGVKDPSCAVIDEVLGMGITLLWVPREWPYLIMGLVLFRIFDIWKPPPIKKLEKLPGGWGIMVDDFMAGLYANIWLQIGILIIHFIS